MRRWVQSVSKQGLRRPGRETRASPRASGARRGPWNTTRVTSSLASFTDWRWCTGQHKNCVALRPPCGLSYHHPLLATSDFQGSRGLKQKRKLSPGPDTSGHKPDPVTRARHTYDPGPPKGKARASPNTGHGMITVFPFATASQLSSYVGSPLAAPIYPRVPCTPRLLNTRPLAAPTACPRPHGRPVRGPPSSASTRRRPSRASGVLRAERRLLDAQGQPGARRWALPDSSVWAHCRRWATTSGTRTEHPLSTSAPIHIGVCPACGTPGTQEVYPWA